MLQLFHFPFDLVVLEHVVLRDQQTAFYVKRELLSHVNLDFDNIVNTEADVLTKLGGRIILICFCISSEVIFTVEGTIFFIVVIIYFLPLIVFVELLLLFNFYLCSFGQFLSLILFSSFPPLLVGFVAVCENETFLSSNFLENGYLEKGLRLHVGGRDSWIILKSELVVDVERINR